MADLFGEETITKEYFVFRLYKVWDAAEENDGHRAIGMLIGGMSVNAVAIFLESTAAPFGDFRTSQGNRLILDRQRYGRPKALTARE